LKKARCLADEAVSQLDYQAHDDPEEFPGLRSVEVESFNEVQPEPWNSPLPGLGKTRRGPRQSARATSASVSTSMTTRRTMLDGNGSQGCSTWAPKDEPSDDDDDDGDYSVFYRRLKMN
jgi:hypothetical protein